MKKVFFALLFLSLLGAGVLIWLIRTAPSSPLAAKPETESAVHIVDEKHEEAAKVAEAGEEKKDEKKEEDKEEKVADKPAEKMAEKSEEKSGEKAAEKLAAASHTLSIHTEPTGAKVWVDGKERGVTPFELSLTALSQMVQIESPGYADFTRSAPSEAESGNGELNWKIQLKKKVEAEAAKKAEVADDEAGAVKATETKVTAQKSPVTPAPAPVPKPKANRVVRAKPAGPFYVQLKSLPKTSSKDEDLRQAVTQLRLNLSSKDDIFECRVNVPGKGEYVRILVGPFVSKVLARESLSEYRKILVDAYVTGPQKCLK